jgi:TRAP-type mannitol/chloroaromatic compound transport system permease large subunit
VAAACRRRRAAEHALVVGPGAYAALAERVMDVHGKAADRWRGGAAKGIMPGDELWGVGTLTLSASVILIGLLAVTIIVQQHTRGRAQKFTMAASHS